MTPSHQFPLGGLMPLARRLELLRWAEGTGAHVLEDDYDSEFRYEGRPVEAVQGLDRSGRVLYVGHVLESAVPVAAPRLSRRTAAAGARGGRSEVPDGLPRADVRAGGAGRLHQRRTFRALPAPLARAERRAARGAPRRAERAPRRSGRGRRRQRRQSTSSSGCAAWTPRSSRRSPARRGDGVGIYGVGPYYLRRPREAGLLFGYACLNERDIRRGLAS